MTAITKAWVTIADGACDPDSPIDAALMTGYRDIGIHLREWIGASYYAGAVQNHNHDGLNSANVVLADLSVATAKYQNLSVTEAKLAAASVSQSKMKTSVGTLLHLTGWQLLPGGEYGNMPQAGSNTAANAWGGLAEGSISNTAEIGGANDITNAGFVGWLGGSGNSAYYCYVYLTQAGNSCVGAHVQQRYTSASPPYDYGNGQAHLFIYGLVDGNGKLGGVWIAPDPAWAYNGRTWIAPDYYRAGKGYQDRLILPADLRDLERHGPQFEAVEVTQELKNADIDLVPHPFGKVPDGQRVVLLDPCCELMAKLAQMHDVVTDQNGLNADPHGFDYSPPGFLLYNDYIKLDNAPFKGRTPKGVLTVTPRWKLTR